MLAASLDAHFYNYSNFTSQRIATPIYSQPRIYRRSRSRQRQAKFPAAAPPPSLARTATRLHPQPRFTTSDPQILCHPTLPTLPTHNRLQRLILIMALFTDHLRPRPRARASKAASPDGDGGASSPGPGGIPSPRNSSRAPSFVPSDDEILSSGAIKAGKRRPARLVISDDDE